MKFSQLWILVAGAPFLLSSPCWASEEPAERTWEEEKELWEAHQAGEAPAEESPPQQEAPATESEPRDVDEDEYGHEFEDDPLAPVVPGPVPAEQELEPLYAPYEDPSDERPRRRGWHKEKDGPFPEFVVAYGVWHSEVLQVYMSLISGTFHNEGALWGAHIRGIVPSLLQYEEVIVDESGDATQKTKYTFAFNFLEVGPRLHFAGPVYLTTAAGFGLSFHDGVVPVADLQLGLGGTFRGWGLEAGVRTSLMPVETRIVDEQDYTRTRYGLMAYLAFETDFVY